MLNIATLFRVVQILVSLIICRVVLAVWLNYADYFPPNFRADFLLGRKEYFFGPYQWSFYLHILSGPITLLAGLLLINNSFRQRFPKWHRYFGAHSGCTDTATSHAQRTLDGVSMPRPAPWLVLALPHSLWQLPYTTVRGWRTAVRRRFAEHRRLDAAVLRTALLGRGAPRDRRPVRLFRCRVDLSLLRLDQLVIATDWSGVVVSITLCSSTAIRSSNTRHSA